MHQLSTALIFVSSALLHHQASAETLAVLTSPTNRGYAKDALIRARQIQELQTGMNYCFGIDSICGYANNFYADCESVMDSNNLTPWYECICGNGYMSTDLECYWCQIAFNLTSTDPAYASAMSGDSAGCSSAHATIAPVPSSIIASISAWNVTFAGFLATASTFSFSTSTAAESYTSTLTLGGGALPTSTTPSAPQTPQSTVATATTTKTASNTGGADGWKAMSSVAVVLSILNFGVAVLYVL